MQLLSGPQLPVALSHSVKGRLRIVVELFTVRLPLVQQQIALVAPIQVNFQCHAADSLYIDEG